MWFFYSPLLYYLGVKGSVFMEILKVALTAFFSAASIFVFAKLMGHKQIAQLDIFDYLNGITMGSIAAELATELENPVLPFTALVIYSSIAIILSIMANKLPRTRKIINGTPTILMSNGTIYRKNLKKSKLDLSEFLMMCRMQGYFDLSNIQVAVYEYNGSLSILPVSTQRPATPQDMGLNPSKAEMFTEVIMDGRIMGENIKRMGMDDTWLTRSLNKQGYKSAKEIFLAVCDSNGNLTVYKNK